MRRGRGRTVSDLDPEAVQDFLSESYLTLDQAAAVLKIKVKTLRSRLGTGTEHPPYVELRRGVYLFPKRLFLDWIGKRPIIWEVKSAS